MILKWGLFEEKNRLQDEKVRLDRAHNFLVVGSIGKGTTWRQHNLNAQRKLVD